MRRPSAQPFFAMTQAPDDISAPRYRFLVLFASVVMVLFGGCVMFTMVVALKPIAADFGWPREVPSLAYSMGFIGGGLGSIAMGHVLDRWGMHMPATIGAIMVGLAAIFLSQAQAQWQFYLIFLLMVGLFGQGALNSPMMANVLRWYARGGMAIGLVAAGQSLGGIIWPPVSGYLMAGIGWRDTFLWIGITALIVMLPLSLVFRRRPPPTPPRATGGRRRRSPAAALADEIRLPMRPGVFLYVLAGASVCCCVAMSMPLAHLVSHITDNGYSATRGAEVLSTILLMSLINRVAILGPLVDRVGGLWALLIFSGFQAAGLLIFNMTDALWVMYGTAVIFGIGYGGILPVYPVIVHELLPRGSAGRRTGIIMMFAAGGMALGGWMGGYTYDLFGSYKAAFAIALTFNAINLLVIGLLIHRTRVAATLAEAA